MDRSELEKLYHDFANKFGDNSKNKKNEITDKIINDKLEQLLNQDNIDYFDAYVTRIDGKLLERDLIDYEFGYNIIKDKPKKLELPEDLKIFYNNYNGLVLNLCFIYDGKNAGNTYFYDISHITNGTKTITNAHPENGDIFNTSNLDELEADIEIRAYDWYNILFDVNSCDNGCGQLLVNLNPESELYGHILSYISTDEGNLHHVGDSFSDMIRNLLETFTGLDDNSDSDNDTCSSITDHLGKYCKCYY